MASPVDICNMALAYLGDKATVSSIDPPEGSAQAGQCATFFPIALDMALEARRWGFNTVRSTNNPIMQNPQPNWLYAYAVPDNCLKILKVIPAQFAAAWWSITDDSFRYTREIEELTGQDVILTNVVNAVIVYQIRITDTSRLPAQFIDAVAWLLASKIAGPIVKGDAGRKAAQSAMQAYMQAVSVAALLDAQQSKPNTRRVPDSIRARSGGWSNRAWCDAPVAGPYGDYAYPFDDVDGSTNFFPEAPGL